MPLSFTSTPTPDGDPFEVRVDVKVCQEAIPPSRVRQWHTWGEVKILWCSWSWRGETDREVQRRCDMTEVLKADSGVKLPLSMVDELRLCDRAVIG